MCAWCQLGSIISCVYPHLCMHFQHGTQCLQNPARHERKDVGITQTQLILVCKTNLYLINVVWCVFCDGWILLMISFGTTRFHFLICTEWFFWLYCFPVFSPSCVKKKYCNIRVVYHLPYVPILQFWHLILSVFEWICFSHLLHTRSAVCLRYTSATL